MKRLLFIVLAMIATITSFAQQKDVTSFLGIPVDGTVLSMKQKLVSKGFVPKKVGTNEFLEGEFNGCNVHVYIRTNNNKVYRIINSSLKFEIMAKQLYVASQRVL